jgi:periplasmic protein TonB
MTQAALRPIEWQTWALQEEADRRFRRFALRVIVPVLLLGLAVPFIQLAGVQRGGGEPPGPRYAELLAPPAATPPAPREEQPRTEETRPTKPQPTPEQKLEQSRAKASKLMQQFDALAELRDTNAPVVDRPLTTSVITSRSATGAPAFASSATATSGGIGETGVVRREDSRTGVGERRTTSVQSPVGSGADQALAGQGGRNLMAGRTLEEIQLVFDRNKGSFYTLYNRALRERPDMQGKVVVRMTIAPSGQVTRCTLVSSELNNPELERKLVARVLLLQFAPKNVGDITIDFPFTLFPAT